MVCNVKIQGVIGVDTTLESVIAQINVQDVTSLRVVIDSPGGMVDEGFEIYRFIKSFDIPVTTIGVNDVSSIATVIFMAGNERIITPGTRFMIHKPLIDFEGFDGVLTESDLQNLLTDIKKADKRIRDFYTNNTPLTTDTLDILMKRETTLTPEKVVSYGFATKISNPFMNIVLKKTPMVAAMIKAGLLKPANLNIDLSDGTKLYVYSEDGEVVGKQVVLADEEGNPTESPAPDGEHSLSDGRTITVESGVITDVSEGSTQDAKYDEEEMKDVVAKEVAKAVNKLKAEMQKEKEGFAEMLAQLSSNYTPPKANNAKAAKTPDYAAIAKELAEARRKSSL
jgi:ATP-dependent protease ClpP protease subunit